MKKLPRNPSITPSTSLRQNLESREEGVTERLNQIWERYQYICSSAQIELELEEIELLKHILDGAVVDSVFIKNLEFNVLNSKQFQENKTIARTLFKKIGKSDVVAKLALIEKLGR